jgi:hypothetical protein
MNEAMHSPRITQLSWGHLEVEDGSFKDAKLFPGGSREWDWNETGTDHVVGIQPADVEELLEHGASVVVLSRGFYERLQICQQTLQMLQDKNISVHVEQTEEAVRLYNELRETERVGALIHSTCWSGCVPYCIQVIAGEATEPLKNNSGSPEEEREATTINDDEESQRWCRLRY